jgi:hypothetical protein
MYMSLEACCCSSNLCFNLYCLMRSAFFRFLTASMSVSAILVTRCACATADCYCLYLCSPTPLSYRYVTRVAVNVPGVTSTLHELRDLAKVIRKSSAKTYTCQYNAARSTNHQDDIIFTGNLTLDARGSPVELWAPLVYRILHGLLFI